MTNHTLVSMNPDDIEIVEPNDDERSQWLNTTSRYVEALEDKVKLFEKHELYGGFWEGVFNGYDEPLETKEKIARELSDYSFMMEQVPKVYSEISGGVLSKPNYYASSVINVFQDYLDNIIEMVINERIEEGTLQKI